MKKRGNCDRRGQAPGRALWRLALSFGDATTVRVAFNGDDVRVVGEPIDEGGGDRRVGKDRRPVAEASVDTQNRPVVDT
jgi:hypothetical protein